MFNHYKCYRCGDIDNIRNEEFPDVGSRILVCGACGAEVDEQRNELADCNEEGESIDEIYERRSEEFQRSQDVRRLK